MEEKITLHLFNSSLNVVAIETLSNTASTATFANRFCSVKEIPNFSNVLSNSGSTSSRFFNFFF